MILIQPFLHQIFLWNSVMFLPPTVTVLCYLFHSDIKFTNVCCFYLLAPTGALIVAIIEETCQHLAQDCTSVMTVTQNHFFITRPIRSTSVISTQSSPLSSVVMVSAFSMINIIIITITVIIWHRRFTQFLWWVRSPRWKWLHCDSDDLRGYLAGCSRSTRHHHHYHH